MVMRFSLILEHLTGGSEDGQRREVGAEVAAINRSEAVRLGAGVCGDEKIREEMLAWPALAPITQKRLAGQVSCFRGEGVVDQAQRFKLGLGFPGIGKANRTLRKNGWTKEQAAFFRSLAQ